MNIECIDPEVIAEAENAYQAAVVEDEAMEAAIRAANAAQRLKEEYSNIVSDYLGPQVRLVSDWRSVEDPS